MASRHDIPWPETFRQRPAAPRGTCCYCRTAIRHPEGHKRAGEVNGRSSWHPACISTFKLHAWPEIQRHHVLKRDGPCCRACGIDTTTPTGWKPEMGSKARPLSIQTMRDWSSDPAARRDLDHGRYTPIVQETVGFEVDHIVPLWSINRDAPGALAFWGPTNLQLLCCPCHRAKSRIEAASRAAARRTAG